MESSHYTRSRALNVPPNIYWWNMTERMDIETTEAMLYTIATTKDRRHM